MPGQAVLCGPTCQEESGNCCVTKLCEALGENEPEKLMICLQQFDFIGVLT